MPPSAPIGPFAPSPLRPDVYCMAGDEGLMFAPERRLGAHQLRHHELMRYNILPYALAMWPLSKPEDQLVLDELWLTTPELLRWHGRFYERMGLTPTRQLHFAPPRELYRRALRVRPAAGRVLSVCYSYAVAEVASIRRELRATQTANSKIELVRRAPRAGYPIPRSLVVPSARLRPEVLARHLGFPRTAVYAKADGLGGGFNVKRLRRAADCAAFAESYATGTTFVVQEAIDRRRWSEEIADFVLRPTGVSLANVRRKLTYQNQWFGNVYSPRLYLNDAQFQGLLACTAELQRAGYAAPEGLLCGMDYFQNGRTLQITDVNARFTGGYPVALLLDRLGLRDKTLAYGHWDLLHPEDEAPYRKLVEKHAPRPGRAPKTFALFPVSFSPAVQEGRRYVWLLVFGDYRAFLEEKRRRLPPRSLELAELVGRAVNEDALHERYGV